MQASDYKTPPFPQSIVDFLDELDVKNYGPTDIDSSSNDCLHPAILYDDISYTFVLRPGVDSLCEVNEYRIKVAEFTPFMESLKKNKVASAFVKGYHSIFKRPDLGASDGMISVRIQLSDDNRFKSYMTQFAPNIEDVLYGNARQKDILFSTK